MKDSVEASIIIVNWNGVNYLKECLDSLLSQVTVYKFNIIIVDNGSTDNSLNFIKVNYANLIDSQIFILKLSTNTLFAYANNYGISFAIKSFNPKFVSTFNNDAIACKDWLQESITAFKRDNSIAIVTPKILLKHPYLVFDIDFNQNSVLKEIKTNDVQYKPLIFINEHFQIINFPIKIYSKVNYRFAVPITSSSSNILLEDIEIKANNKSIKVFGSSKTVNFSNNEIYLNKSILDQAVNIVQNTGLSFSKSSCLFFENHFLEIDKEIKSDYVDSGCGCAMVLKVDVFNQLGGFNEFYKLYNEDTELSWRYGVKGHKSFYNSSSIIRHYYWGSTKNFSSTRVYYGTRNRLLFIRQYFSFFTYLKYSFRTFCRCVYFLILMLFNSKVGKNNFKPYLNALIDSIKYRVQ